MTDALAAYGALAIPLAPADLAILRRDVRAHFEELERLRAREELSACDLAEELCSRLEVLLGDCDALDAAGRAAVVGAARYFVSAHDVVPDEQGGGLDDDVEVFNHVTLSVGRAELSIRR